MRNPNFLDFKFIAKPKGEKINMKTQKTKHLPMFASLSGYFVNRRCTQTGNKKRNFVWILTILMFTGLLGLAEMSLAAEGSWTKKADMPTPRTHLSTSVVNGKIYAIGGSTSWPAPLSIVEEYDPVTDTWTKKADMPTPRLSPSTSVVNGKIYAIGGWDVSIVPWGGFSTVEEYDPTTDTWTKKADMPSPRGGLSTSVVNGKIYAIGGLPSWPAPLSLSIVEKYDPVTDTWTKKADMPSLRGGLSTSAVNGKIYAIGGTVDGSIGRSTVEEYDPTTDTWTKEADMPTPRYAHSTSAVNGKIYAIGGALFYPPPASFSTVEEYTPEGWPFTAVSPQGKLATTWGEIKR